MGMSGRARWMVRKGDKPRTFSDWLVMQGGRPGILDLSICRAASAQASPASLGLLFPLAAACTSEGIRRDTGILSWLHWPNLVTIEGRVVAQTSLSITKRDGPVKENQLVFRIHV